MTKLKAVKPTQAKKEKPKILVFGKAGVGKTWGALDFPSVYYIDTEGGATEQRYVDKLVKSGGVYLGKEEGSQSFESVIEQIKALSTEKHGFKTVIIDSFTKLFDIEVANEVERLTAAKTPIAYGIEKKSAVKLTKRLIAWFDKLDMNVILICHSKNEYVKGESIGFTFDGYEKLEYELHLCLEISKQGNSRKAFIRKTRLEGFPDSKVFEWSYGTFAEMMGKELLESDAVPAVLATAEQVAKVKKLLENIKLGDSAGDKRIEEVKDNLEEIESDKIEKIITYLQNKTI